MWNLTYFDDLRCWPVITFWQQIGMLKFYVEYIYKYNSKISEICWVLGWLAYVYQWFHSMYLNNFILDILWRQSTRSTGLETWQKSPHGESTETS